MTHLLTPGNGASFVQREADSYVPWRTLRPKLWRTFAIQWLYRESTLWRTISWFWRTMTLRMTHVRQNTPAEFSNFAIKKKHADMKVDRVVTDGHSIF